MQLPLVLALALPLARGHPLAAGPERAPGELRWSTTFNPDDGAAAGADAAEPAGRVFRSEGGHVRVPASVMEQIRAVLRDMHANLDDDDVEVLISTDGGEPVVATVEPDAAAATPSASAPAVVSAAAAPSSSSSSSSSPPSSSPAAAPTTAPAPAPAPPAPAPAPPAEAPPPPPASDDDDDDEPTPPGSTTETEYLHVANKWRRIMGLPELALDPALEPHALKASLQSDGETGLLKHTTFPGEAQVMAPGKEGSFEYVFVGGWLCEMPDLPGIGDRCAEIARGVPGEKAWVYGGQTGHAKHLSNSRYRFIGCAFANSVWTCSLK